MKEKFGKVISIGISEETHSLLKEHCSKNALKIGPWVDNLVRNEICKLNK